MKTLFLKLKMARLNTSEKAETARKQSVLVWKPFMPRRVIGDWLAAAGPHLASVQSWMTTRSVLGY